MKSIKLIIITLFFTTTGMAEEFSSRIEPLSYKTQSPKGEQVQCFPQKQVDSWAKRKKKKQVEKVVEVKEVVKEVVKTVEVTKEVEPKYMNAVKLYMGVGPGFTAATRLGNIVTLEDKLGFVPGIGYERRLDSHWSLEGIWLFNKSVILGGGYSF